MGWRKWQLAWVGVVISQGHHAAAEPAPHQLRAASGSSPRPMECLPSSGRVGHGYTLWDRARQPRLVEYCDALARGYSRLDTQPGDSMLAAEQATKAQPNRVAPLVLKGQSLQALGQAAKAYQAFQTAFERQRDLRLSPEGLHAYALAAVGSRHFEQGLVAYRRLVPMAGLLTRIGAGEATYVEAAIQVLLHDPAQLQEAVAYLNEARRRSATPELRPYVLAALALALDRQGRTEEARGVASEARGRIEQMAANIETGRKSTRVQLPQLEPPELLAMIATVAAADDQALGREYWADFLEQAPADHPWRAHALERSKANR